VKFPKDDLTELTYGSLANYDVITTEITGTSRWSIHYKMIFSFDHKFYSTEYSRGATEYQDEGPYEYDSEEVECPEVKPVQKTITVYEPIT